MDKQNSTNKVQQGNSTNKTGSQYSQKKNNGNAQDRNSMNEYSDSMNGKQSGKN
ncbi:MAG TPA: hypothetical protein VHO94_05055 [Oscillospiraceae bacterium]|nr:hypothetical protein [Oscillospiraceae bacterium]